MVRLIMSGSGEGKTKQLLELMNAAADTETGCMVCIEPTRNMSFSLRHQTRLVDASEFGIDSFVCGMYAGNYDISHVFVDNLCKVAHDTDERNVGAFLNWMEKFCAPLNLKITVTVSGDPGSATDTMRKYM